MKVGETIFPGEELPIGYLIPNGQPGKHMLISDIIQTEKVVFMYLGTHTHTNKEKPGHEFDRD